MSSNNPTIASGLLLMEKEEFDLSLENFIELLWDNSFYEDLLVDKLFEKDVIISAWKNEDEENLCTPIYKRTTSSQHPLPVLSIIAWLNLPLYITSSKIQSAKFDSKFGIFIVTETSSIQGIPLLEIDVELEWRIFEKIDRKCEVNVGVQFIYKSFTMIKGLIESITIDELNNFLRIWIESARALIEKKTAFSKGLITEPKDHPVEKRLIYILKAVSDSDICSTITARNLAISLPVQEDEEERNIENDKGELEGENPDSEKNCATGTFNTWWT